jgi:hypothetical protein
MSVREWSKHTCSQYPSTVRYIAVVLTLILVVQIVEAVLHWMQW